MNRLTRWWHSAGFFVSTVAVWVALPGMALAQEKGAESSTPPYVGPYFIVILCLALGLMVVCNPDRRKEKAKPFEAPGQELLQK